MKRAKFLSFSSKYYYDSVTQLFCYTNLRERAELTETASAVTKVTDILQKLVDEAVPSNIDTRQV